MSNLVKDLEKKLAALYTNATKKIDNILSDIDFNSYTQDDINDVVAQIKKNKNAIVSEIASAGNNARSAMDNNSLRLYKQSYLQSLNDFNKKIGHNLDWDIPNNEEFERMLEKEINIYDRKAAANLSDKNIINRRFENALIAVVVAKVAINKIKKEITDKTVRRGWNDSTRLARTKSTGILNGARFEGFNNAEKMGIRGVKKWVSTYDGRTRMSHVWMQAQKEELNDIFANECMYPRDPNGPPGEVVNCRCTVSYVMEGSQEFNYSIYEGDDLEELLEEVD